MNASSVSSAFFLSYFHLKSKLISTENLKTSTFESHINPNSFGKSTSHRSEPCASSIPWLLIIKLCPSCSVEKIHDLILNDPLHNIASMASVVFLAFSLVEKLSNISHPRKNFL